MTRRRQARADRGDALSRILGAVANDLEQFIRDERAKRKNTVEPARAPAKRPFVRNQKSWAEDF